jgi:hypothetical protein
MPLHPNVRRCTHIQITGHRCGSPALKQEYFCYFHTRMIKGVQTRVDSQINPIALLENAEAIQAAIMRTIDSVLKGAIDNKRAALVLKALHIAVRNARNVYFHIRPDDMVREVPDYAHQYLTEHPELNPEKPPEQSEGTLKKNCHPERSMSASEANAHAKSKDPEQAGHANTASGNSPAAILPQTQPAPRKNCHPERSMSASEANAHAKSKDPELAAHADTASGNSPDATRENTTGIAAPTPAAKRRKNAAQGASRGRKARDDQAPEERKKSYDTLSDALPLTNRETERNHEIKKLEASIDGAMRGNWRDLRTVFDAAGLTPRRS